MPIRRPNSPTARPSRRSGPPSSLCDPSSMERLIAPRNRSRRPTLAGQVRLEPAGCHYQNRALAPALLIALRIGYLRRAVGTPVHRDSTSSNPHPAPPSGRLDVRSPDNGPWRAFPVSCRSSRCARSSGTSAGAPTASQGPGTPRTRAPLAGGRKTQPSRDVRRNRPSDDLSRSALQLPGVGASSAGSPPGIQWASANGGVSRRYHSASRAPIQPVPAAVTAWR
jgi:hypothetical protein